MLQIFKLKNKRSTTELIFFGIYFCVIAIYYGVRLFKYAPWYDELYTYNYFISRGPVYSAIHWPVPNNHIGYSVLSGFVYWITHNSWLSLRLISYMSSLIGIILFFSICRSLLDDWYSIIAVILYSGMWLVNNLAVQGRGYALCTCMMLVCIQSMVHICLDDVLKGRWYAFWSIAMIYGLYTVTTSIYWVIGISLCAGIILLVYKRFNRLVRLIEVSLLAALGTLFLYCTVWLAIGSNLLIKELDVYTGMGHVSVIMHHPIEALFRGIEYMLATPYIQSVSKEGYILQWLNHFKTLMSQFYGILDGTFLIVCTVIAVIIGGWQLRKSMIDKQQFVFCCICVTMLLSTPLIVFAQFKLPYYRVFSYYGIFVSMGLVLILSALNSIHEYVKIKYGIGIVICLAVFTQLVSSSYNNTYGSREQDAYDLLANAELTSYENIVVTDCDLEYMYKFVYDNEPSIDLGLVKECIQDQSNKSLALIIGNDVLDPNAEFIWENYYDFSTIDPEIMNSLSGTNNSGKKMVLKDENLSYRMYCIN